MHPSLPFNQFLLIQGFHCVRHPVVQVWGDNVVVNLVALFLQAVVHVFVVVAVHYVIAHAVVVEQVAYVAGPGQVQVCRVLPAVVVLFVDAAVIVVDGFVALFVEVVVVFVDIVVVVVGILVVIVAVVAGGIAVVAPVVVICPNGCNCGILG